MVEHDRRRPVKSLDFNVKVLKGVGLWPYRNENIGWQKTFSYYFPRITLISASLLILSKCIDSIFIDSSLRQVIEHIYMSIMTLMAILKNASLLNRTVEVEKLIVKIQNLNWSELRVDRKQAAIHNQYQRYAEILTKIYLSTVFFLAITLALGPLTKKGEKNPMPHKMYYPYNHTISPYYELTYAWLSITAISDGFFIGVCDSLFLSLLLNVIGHYKILQYKMFNIRENAAKKVLIMDKDLMRTQRLKETAKESEIEERVNFQHANEHMSDRERSLEESSQIFKRSISKYRTSIGIDPYRRKCVRRENAVQKEMENYISNVVEHHIGIMSVVKEIESVFGNVLLYQFAPSLFFLCMVAFKVAKASHFDASFISLLQLLLGSIFQLFLYCWYSSTLTDESTKLNEALYHCNWLKSSISFKKSIRLIFLRANKPIFLNAAGFVNVSLELFRNVLRTSYSFYTLLNQLDSPKNHQ